MIFMPVASSLIFPSVAAASFLFMDSVVTLPLLKRALRHCDWGTVLPAAAGALLAVHAGAWLLANTEVLLLRWIIFAIVAGLLALLMSGWRYNTQPSRPVSFGVGATSGFLGGISQVSAPPVAAFWLSSSKEPEVVRANLIVFFALASVGTFIAYIALGFFTTQVFQFLVIGVPSYAFGLFAGSRLFSQAKPAHYRYAAYVLIALAALTGMPALDTILRQ